MPWSKRAVPAAPADLVDRDWLWADVAPRLYASSGRGQWDPAKAADWDAAISCRAEIEGAVVQLMTYLIENEQAALLVPARLLARIHPHFREVMQLLAVAGRRRSAPHRGLHAARDAASAARLGVSGAGGRASLQTLLEEPDFALAAFMLSVLGEGTFLDLLRFLHTHAPDPVTAARSPGWCCRTRPARGFGVAHTAHAAQADPASSAGCEAPSNAGTRAAHTAGLSEHVHDALVVLAAGPGSPRGCSWLASRPDAAAGHGRGSAPKAGTHRLSR